MNQQASLFAALFGRLLIGGFFLWSAIQKILNFDAFVQYVQQANVPQPLIIATILVATVCLASLALIVDWAPRSASFVLAIYLILASFVFFDHSEPLSSQLFLQNLALVGGLLMIVGNGSSRWGPVSFGSFFTFRLKK